MALISFLFLEFKWDVSSPLLAASTAAGDLKGQLKLSGTGNSIATKIALDREPFNTLVTSAVMEKGVHRISFKMGKGEAEDLGMFCGVVRDGAAWNELHAMRDGAGWFMSRGGSLCGNGKEGDDRAGLINEGQILSLELDLDLGTLMFFVDGKRHGPGNTSGVTGKLRFAATAMWIGNCVQIVPTPELEV